MLRKVFIKPKLVPANQPITGSFFLKTRRLILKLTNVPVFQFDVIFKVPSFHHVQTLETIFTGQIECLYRIMVNFLFCCISVLVIMHCSMKIKDH